MFCEDYSWLKNVQFPTLRCLPEALPGKYLSLGTVWPFPFLGFPLGISHSISSASVIHPPSTFLIGNLLFYLPSNHLHVINFFPSPSPPGFICLPGLFHSHTPTECQKFEFPWTILAPFIYFFPSSKTLKVAPSWANFSCLKIPVIRLVNWLQSISWMLYITDLKVKEKKN